jgi:hypothetical protein
VAGVVPGVERLDRLRVGLGRGDVLGPVGLLHGGPDLLRPQRVDLPDGLALVGQVDAEALLGHGREGVPVVVQGGVDVDGDAHSRWYGTTLDATRAPAAGGGGA